MYLIEDTQKLIEKMRLFDKKTGQWIYFVLWPKQVEFLDVIHNHRKVITVKKRQTGMSQLTGADSLAQCMILGNFTVLVLSKTGPDAQEYLRRVQDMYSSLPDDIKRMCPTVAENKEKIEFANGSRIMSFPANRGAGFTADRVIIDESAFITKTDTKIDLETTLKRVEPTLDKAKGQLILISTANGRNVFYQYWQKAVKKISSFYAFFFSCWDDPTFTKEERDRIEEDHGTDHANQEYPRSADEAFLASGRPRFNIENLKQYEKHPLKQIFKGFLLDDSDELIPDDKGNFEMYESIISREQYAIIADVSEGIENELKDPDYSHVKVFRLSTCTQVAAYHYRIDPALLGSVCWRLARFYNNALVIIERNNHGISTLTQIVNVHEYPYELMFEHDLIVKEKADSDFKLPVPRLGWRTTATTRPLIIDCLAKLIQKIEIDAFSADDIDELMSFVIKNGKAQANESSHDDRVMVLAITYYLLTLDIFYEQYPIEDKEDYHDCISCEYVQINQETSVNRCGRTGRICKDRDWCTLYSRFEYEIEEDFD